MYGAIQVRVPNPHNARPQGPMSDSAPLNIEKINCEQIIHTKKTETYMQGQSPHRLVQVLVRVTLVYAPQVVGQGPVTHSLHTPPAGQPVCEI